VLFDTGCHPQAMGPQGRWLPEYQRDYAHLGGEECCLPHRLEQLGLGPNDFRYVVLSHMHSDHAGCAELFGKSQILVHQDEFAATLDAYRRRDERAYCTADTAAWIDLDLAWRRIGAAESDKQLHDEVRLLNLGRGHAFGMLALAVDLPETGRILLASDAVYCAENLTGMLPGAVEDETGYRATLARLSDLANAGAEIWYGHDPRQFAMLRTSVEGWYE